MRATLVLTSAAALLFSIAGCDDADDGSTGPDTGAATSGAETGGGSGASGADSGASVACGEACVDKAGECGAPAEQASALCDELCGGSVTQEQVDCLADTSCDELTAGFLSGEVCGLGGGSADSGSSGGGDGDSGNDSGTAECVMFGDSCAADGTGIDQCCSGLSCSGGACCVPQAASCGESSECCGNELAGEPVQCVEGVCTQV